MNDNKQLEDRLDTNTYLNVDSIKIPEESLIPDDIIDTLPSQPVTELREQDRWLPINNVARLMKNTLPSSAKVSKEAKECMQECVSEFISFVTSEASDRCAADKRKTINGEDILISLHALGFENYAEVLKIYLAKYRQYQAVRNQQIFEEEMKDENTKGDRSNSSNSSSGSSNSNSNSNSNITCITKSSIDSSGVDGSNSDTNGDSIINTHRKRMPLPQPGESFAKRRKSDDVRPEDMYRSIMMLREKQQREQLQKQGEEDISDDGEPVLFIKGRNINTSSVKRQVKKTQSGANSSRNSIESLQITNSELKSDVDNYSREDNDIDNSPYVNNSRDLNYLSESSLVNTNSCGTENERTDGQYSDTNNELSSGFENAANVTSVAVTDSLSESIRSHQSSSNAQREARLSNQHITFVSNAENDTLRYHDGDLNALSGNKNKEGQSIQFNITAPPRKMARRKSYNSQYSKIVRPAYGKRKQLSSRSILRKLKKGGKLHQNIKRRLSNNNVVKPSNELNTANSKQDKKYFEEQTGNHDGEDYFADNETDEDILFDVSPQKLNELSQAPDFQDMVYESWKASHKHSKRPENKRRKSWIFDNYYKGDHENVGKLNMSSISTSGYMKKDHEGAHPNGSLSSSMDSASDVTSGTQNGSLENYDYDEEDPAYYGLHFDYNMSNNMNLPLSRTMSTNYLSWQPTIGRNSTFVGLTKDQRDELGGVEYRAIKLLCRFVVCYYIGFHVMAFTMFLPWICKMKDYIHIVREDGISPAWWGFFTAMSSFNDLGITLTPNSMSSFATSIYVQVSMIWFMIIGNTGFPILLRLIIWILFHLAPDLSLTKESLGFLLDHPRRWFNLLLPR